PNSERSDVVRLTAILVAHLQRCGGEINPPLHVAKEGGTTQIPRVARDGVFRQEVPTLATPARMGHPGAQLSERGLVCDLLLPMNLILSPPLQFASDDQPNHGGSEGDERGTAEHSGSACIGAAAIEQDHADG